jgi:hypothetical protein
VSCLCCACHANFPSASKVSLIALELLVLGKSVTEQLVLVISIGILLDKNLKTSANHLLHSSFSTILSWKMPPALKKYPCWDLCASVVHCAANTSRRRPLAQPLPDEAGWEEGPPMNRAIDSAIACLAHDQEARSAARGWGGRVRPGRARCSCSSCEDSRSWFLVLYY